MDNKLHKKLTDRKEKGTLRSLSLSSGMIDFGSNDYLGLAKTEFIATACGATGSRLITGHSSTIDDSERMLAEFYESEAALCFNSGYDANLGIFSSIPQRGDVVLYDEHIHASVRDGIRLGLAKSYSFKHNDLEHLRLQLEKNKDDVCYIAIEALYSMNGDFSLLAEIVALAKQYNSYIIIDEAHSAGLFGLDGRGLAHGADRHNDVFIRLVTFGKAYGTHGAVVLCSEDLKSYLINFARSLIYTTALPASSYKHMADIVRHEELKSRRDHLQSNLAHFRLRNTGLDNLSASNSPIQIIRFDSVDQLKRVEESLRAVNIYAKAIFSPTVPEGAECLRVCIHSFNTTTELDALSGSLNSLEAMS